MVNVDCNRVSRFSISRNKIREVGNDWFIIDIFRHYIWLDCNLLASIIKGYHNRHKH